MLSDEDIEVLASYGVDARWTRLEGSLTVEAPAAIQHLHIFGECRVGAFTYSDYDVDLYNCDIGRYCSIASGVKINPGRHAIDFLSTHPFVQLDPWACGLKESPALQAIAANACVRPVTPPGSDRVIIGDDVWIGVNAVILRGLTIGVGAVIGAGAVVTHDVAPYAIVGGAPARMIRKRFPDALIERLLASRWWERDLSVLSHRDYSQVEALLDRLDAAERRPFTPVVLDLDATGVRPSPAAAA